MKKRFKLLSGRLAIPDPKAPAPPVTEMVAGENPQVHERRALQANQEWERRWMRFYRAKDRPPNPDLANLRDDGDVVETDLDLCAMFNPTGADVLTGQLLPWKFERLPDPGFHDDGMPERAAGESPDAYVERIKRWNESRTGGRAAPSPVPAVVGAPGEAVVSHYDNEDQVFESMTVDELRRHAEGEEINLGNAKSKKDIIAVIKAAGSTQPA
jgi:hypothetical protein